MVNAAHIVVKYSKKMRSKYLSIVRRLGKNRAIVAIARMLLETIYIMLVKGEDFIDEIDSLTERKMKSMQARAKKQEKVKDLEESIKFISEKGMRGLPKELFS